MSEHKKFNPKDWLPDEKPQEEKRNKNPIKNLPNKEANQLSDNSIEEIISRIEEKAIDITGSYNSWRDIGFGLSDEYAEGGRDYFHRISKFHPDYNLDACNKQYNNCLKSNKYGITIRTFYYFAKKNGISIHSKNNSPVDAVDKSFSNTPTIPQEIYNFLPDLLRESTSLFDVDIEKDVILMGSLSVLSACLPNIHGKYFNEFLTPHLYSFITAPGGSGKGRLKWTRFLGNKIHKMMINESKRAKVEYDLEQETYNNAPQKEKSQLDKPREPRIKMFFIPANSSASAFLQALSENDFNGAIFETEADTLAQTLKQDWGNFNDVLRKAYHHESSNMFRRKDNEHIEIENPHLSVTLSGTPKQVHNIMPNVENGLFSRFLFYAFQDSGDFKNPFESNDKLDFPNFFNKKGEEVLEIYQTLKSFEESLEFKFTKEQQTQFYNRFKELSRKNRLLLGADFDANIKRLGVITFRIAMILTTLRITETGEFNKIIFCSDTDFEIAFKIALTLEKHAIAVYKNLPSVNLKESLSEFLDQLPFEFNREKYLEVANKLNINPKTAEGYISKFVKNELLSHRMKNHYIKIEYSGN